MAAPRKPKSGGVQKGKTKAGTASPDARVSSGANGNGRVTPSADVIRVRAYEIFLERGDSSGDELSDWLAAEREITKIPSSHS
jgi:hypothetical protein